MSLGHATEHCDEGSSLIKFLFSQVNLVCVKQTKSKPSNLLIYYLPSFKVSTYDGSFLISWLQFVLQRKYSEQRFRAREHMIERMVHLSF